MKKKTRILIVDDEAIIRDSLQGWFSDIGYTVLTAEDGTQALEIINQEIPDILIADLIMPGIDGLELLKRAKSVSPNIEVVVMTAYASIPTAIAAIKQGAYDYIEKPFSAEKVELLIGKLVERQNLIEENARLHQELEGHYRFENIITKSPRMQQIIELIKVVSKSQATVLVRGESGTGKELVAHAIHSQSPRKDRPFIAVSCAALPESLLESELFGHEKGAFTGAHVQRKGKIELAHHGTLFLDEIGEMSANIQVHLLRVLEEREFSRVGGNELISVDTRLVSATNCNLEAAIKDGHFREDLYYRLNVVTIDLPPLRERGEDIPLLAEHFLKRFAIENQKDVSGFSAGVTDFLLKYPWPGNVRELENTIERAVILSKGEEIQVADLLQRNSPLVNHMHSGQNLKEVEREYILNTVNESEGNLTRAARVLGISRATLYNKIKLFGNDVNK